MNDQPAKKAVASINFNKIEIESDGTRVGTKILLNGKSIENLASLSFTFFNSDYSPVSLGFRVEDQEIKAGTLLGSTYFSLIPPKPDDADASKRAVASVGGGGGAGGKGFTLQASHVIPIEHLRGNVRRNAYAQI